MQGELQGRVRSVDRAMILLEAVSEPAGGHRLVDLAGRTGLSPSTVHRLLTTLEHRRFVQFDPSDGLWHVGRKAFAVGSAFMRGRNFVAPALPFLRHLRDLTRETTNLGIVEDKEILLISQIQSREISRPISRIGGRVPLFASGMGKAFLASYTPDQVSASIAKRGLRRITSKTLVRRSALDADLTAVRENGYALDDEEFIPGLRCIASVVYDDMRQALCAVSVSGPLSRIPLERVPAIGKLVAATALELTLCLGGVIPEQNHSDLSAEAVSAR
jgi:IclR family acetate operon transcriptional repressor